MVTALLFLAIVWLSSLGTPSQEEGETRLTPAARRFAEAPGFAEVQDIVLGRCSMCHAAEPAWDGLLWAPRGVRLDTGPAIAAHAPQILVQAGLTDAMPPANVSGMEPAERRKIVAWYLAATGG
jgi:uncharacterized membrane protein